MKFDTWLGIITGIVLVLGLIISFVIFDNKSTLIGSDYYYQGPANNSQEYFDNACKEVCADYKHYEVHSCCMRITCDCWNNLRNEWCC